MPVLNASVEVLARCSLPNDLQGRIWGLMGSLSQVGYVISYALSGLLADAVFISLLVPEGPLADSLGRLFGVGDSRGIGMMFVIVSVLLVLVALVLSRVEVLRGLERRAASKS